MEQEQYRACMKPYMAGAGPDKRMRFCVGAKICSGKAKSEAEAQQICLSQPPKTDKPRSRRRKDCPKEMATIAQCAVVAMASVKLTPENLESTLTEILQKCACGKVSRAQKALENMSPDHLQALQVLGEMKKDYGGNNF